MLVYNSVYCYYGLVLTLSVRDIVFFSNTKRGKFPNKRFGVFCTCCHLVIIFFKDVFRKKGSRRRKHDLLSLNCFLISKCSCVIGSLKGRPKAYVRICLPRRMRPDMNFCNSLSVWWELPCSTEPCRV